MADDVWEEKKLQLAQKLGYSFVNWDLLRVALTHRSVPGQNNERLEFLGDSILSSVISAELYKRFPTATEGGLTRLRTTLVRGETLADIARELEIGEHLQLGLGEVKNGGHQRPSILTDALEAIIGAIYLDASAEVVHDCILRWYSKRLSVLKLSSVFLKDSKTRLQEYLQSRRLTLPEYQLARIGGGDHNPVFHVYCFIALLGEPVIGIGDSRRQAEQNSARAALKALKALSDV